MIMTDKIADEIQKSIDLWDSIRNWNYRADVMNRYKPKIIEKLATIMGVELSSVNCRGYRVKRYLKSVYNIEIAQTSGWRTLIVNGKPHISVKVTASSYAFAELGLIEIACNIIMQAPNFTPGKKEVLPSSLTIEDHMFRVFRYKVDYINTATIRRIKKEFGYYISVKYLPLHDEMVMQIEIFHDGVLIHTKEDSFIMINGTIPWHKDECRKKRKALANEVWRYILAKLPDFNASTRRAELFDMIEDFEHSARIVQLIGNKLRDAVSNGSPLNTGDYDILIKNLSSKLKNIITTNNKRLNL